jgi:hypothetical protein
MPEEEFVISGTKMENDEIVVSFSVTNTLERMNQLLIKAEKKWLRQYGQIPFPQSYKAQIIGQGIPPMIMRLSMAKWTHKGLQLNDKVIINIPENIDDIKPVKTDDFCV